MNFYAWAGLINAVTCFTAGLFVWLRHRGDPRRITFVFFMLSVFTWAFFYFWWQLANNGQTALWLCRGLVIGAFFAPVTHMHHVATLVDATELPWTRRLIRFGYVGASILLLFNPTPFVVREVAPRLFFPYWPLPGPLWHFFTMFYFSYCLYTIGLIRRGLLRSSGTTHNEFQYLLVGTLIAFGGASTNFLLWYDIPIPPLGSIVVPFYVILVALAAIRFQFMDIRIVIRRSLIYSILVTILTAGYFCLVLLAEKWFQGMVGYRSLVTSVVAGFAIALGFIPLKNSVQRLVDRLFFRAPREELITRLERLERELREADKLKAVSLLTAGMAHEIKNPLTGIKTFTSFLREKGSDPAFRETFARIVGPEVDRIEQLVRHVLEFAKPQSASCQPTNISALLDETLELLNSNYLARRVKVERSYGSHGLILVDPPQLRQVFLNLLLNSLEAMPGGGRLAVSTSDDGAELTVTIEDAGVGISQEHLKRICDPFFTTKPNGTGLGLSIVRDLVREHGGTLVFDSQLGLGTRCTLKFPLLDGLSDGTGCRAYGHRMSVG